MYSSSDIAVACLITEVITVLFLALIIAKLSLLWAKLALSSYVFMYNPIRYYAIMYFLLCLLRRVFNNSNNKYSNFAADQYACPW